ncbi:MAG: hypothetical protein F2659_00065 [Actinobacteria bacterium]|uniref:Unannotated protein n=1 Tax=freshwater metagenome TaxID=449393 RepID=A0A6J6MWC7_9ZZZZ|nr:hypothetical protein [Actinomycetota bacterium]
MTYRFPTLSNTPVGDPEIAGVPNWFYVTDSLGDSERGLRPQAGIWNPRLVQRNQTSQIPLVICTSSPHKGGTAETPWADVLRPDDGYVIYYGDNKDPANRDATTVRGNRTMLEVMRLQHSASRAERLMAPPILVVTTHGATGLGKGFRRVEGLGVITRAEVISQRHADQPLSFQNLRFEIAIVDLKDDGDAIPMSWINARRREAGGLVEQYELAPHAWRRFVDEGITVVDKLRRNVLRGMVRSSNLQLPSKGSPLEDLLIRTVAYFDFSKHDFETVAARVVERIFDDQGVNYRTGWLTPRSGDGGYDFVGRIDFDPAGGFPSSRQVVLGQAKCERGSTNGRDLARLAARLRRGWHGAYVTTANFTEGVQREVLSDRYPLLMVPGLRVASIIKDELDSTGKTLDDYLPSLEGRYKTSGVGLSDVDLVLLG